MFLLNLGFRWNIGSDIDQLQGAVLLPTGNHRERLMRRLPEFRRLLFDPQLYLSGLDPETCRKTCARLATFPWFGADGIEEFDSDSGGIREWESNLRDDIDKKWIGQPVEGKNIGKACSQAIDFQIAIGSTHIVLPSPLIDEREAEAEVQAEWLDAGVNAAAKLEAGQPLLSTVAISESVLNDRAFDNGGFLDTVVDQVSSRNGIDGVYIVIVQTHSGHPFQTDIKVHRAYRALCEKFSSAGYSTVITNFADMFGLACLGAGATGFATGDAQKLRRLSFECFKDDGGGKSYPYYYSHRICGEFLSESDVSKLVEARMMRRLRDVTDFSEPLLDAIDNGQTASSVASWAESQNNVAAAHKHFIRRLVLEDRAVAKLGHAERSDAIRDWLTDAAASALLLERRTENEDIPGKIAPTAEWLELFEEMDSES